MNRYEALHHEQEHDFSCGPASLLIAYRKMGLEYDEHQLMSEMGVGVEGTDWKDLFEHTVKMGLKSKLVGNASLDDMAFDLKKGVIIVGYSTDVNGTPQGHFSVLNETSDDLIELIDPGLKLDENPHIMPVGEFLLKWNSDSPTRSYLLLYEL